MAFNQGIFPTSVYGQLSDSYGLPGYTATVGFPGPTGSGLVLGQGWLLFDFTIVNLLKCVGAIAANAACNPVGGLTYVVQSAISTGFVGQVPVTAINDRGGALTVSGGINWMTTSGAATALCSASLPASTAPTGTPLAVSNIVSGQLTAAAAGVAFYSNVILLGATSAAGAYPVLLNLG
jgi:hypothetical protein